VSPPWGPHYTRPFTKKKLASGNHSPESAGLRLTLFPGLIHITLGTYRMVTDRRVRDHPFFQAAWVLTNLLSVGSLLFLLYALCWEYSTRRYLTGFSDAVVAAGAPPEEKVQAILDWMAAGPRRRAGTPNGMFYQRDPLETLNYRRLLQVCGSATNAFINNLARTNGVKVRRLLLLNAQGAANHVVAEVLLQGNWVVVDPTFRRILRDSHGRPLTSEQLKDASVLKAATQGLEGYSPMYSYEHTDHLRLARVPLLGPFAGRIADSLLPGWDLSGFATLFVERESFTALVCSVILSAFFVLMRVLLGWYAGHLGVQRVRFAERLRRGSLAFLKQGS